MLIWNFSKIQLHKTIEPSGVLGKPFAQLIKVGLSLIKSEVTPLVKTVLIQKQAEIHKNYEFVNNDIDNFKQTNGRYHKKY